MRKILCVLIEVACIVAGCAGSPSTAVPASTPSLEASQADADGRSLAFVKLLAAGEFEGAFGQLDDGMKRAVGTWQQLGAVWIRASQAVGDSAELRIDERHQKEEHAVRILQLDGARGSLRPLISVGQDGRIAGMYFLPPKPRATQPPLADPRSANRSIALTIGSAHGALPATLTKPTGDGPHPAVLLVAGSGPHDRDETVGPNKPFRDLADQLAAEGVASLRYDKRTHAHPRAIDVHTLTVEEEVIADAVAAADQLAAHGDVRRDCVLVVGHSLGALLAPEIAARAKAVAATVLLAAPGRPVSEVAVQQLRFLGQLPEAELQRLEQQASDLRAGKLAPSDTFLSVPVRYWTDLDRRDEIAIARKLGKPLLYLRGARDYQVLAQDLDAWRRGLGASTTASFETLAELNHLFIRSEGPPGPAEYERSGTVAPAVAARIARFVQSSCPKK
ncbi:MAG: alpha/beta fold hydrolase [Polyangiales bacterium]